MELSSIEREALKELNEVEKSGHDVRIHIYGRMSEDSSLREVYGSLAEKGMLLYSENFAGKRFGGLTPDGRCFLADEAEREKAEQSAILRNRIHDWVILLVGTVLGWALSKFFG